jgi:D-alanyl-D-alanine carboxypeptidase
MIGVERWPIVAVAGLIALSACTATPPQQPSVVTSPPATTATTTTAATTTTTVTTTTIPPDTTTASPHARPVWLGTRVLPVRPDGFGLAQPTPLDLENRQFETIDVLPPPLDAGFAWTATAVPDDVLARSSWREGCPVDVDDLTYLTLSHFGFDGRFHTGELLVNAAWADDIVEVFRKLHEARFPIEEMRIIRLDEIDAPPTGDGNVTSSFECRPATGSTGWSYHAYGLAVDINPFHNPYVKGDLILPELASSYLDRSLVRPGMVVDGDVVTTAFDDIGWGWGGNWRTVKDWMHFSSTGR